MQADMLGRPTCQGTEGSLANGHPLLNFPNNHVSELGNGSFSHLEIIPHLWLILHYSLVGDPEAEDQILDL